MVEIRRLIALVLFFWILIGCGSYDNAYDPANREKDSDGDGILNRDDPEPTTAAKSPISKQETNTNEGTTGTNKETSGGVDSNLIATTTEKYPLSITLSSSITSMSFRESNKSIVVIDDAAQMIYAFDISSGSPTASGSTKITWKTNSGLSSWDGGNFYRLTQGDGVTGKLFRYNSSFVEQGAMPTDKVFPGYGGAVTSNGEILVFDNTSSEAPGIYKINLGSATSAKVGAMDCKKVYSAEYGCPVLDSARGYGQASARYWVLGKVKGVDHLISFDQSAVIVGKAKIEVPSGDTLKQISGDGTSIWILTTANFLKVTPK